MQVTAGNGAFTISPDDASSGALPAAIKAARRLGPARARTIALESGSYLLDEPIVLDARDNGLTIEVVGRGEAVLYGGRRVTGWERDGDRLWSAALPEVASGKLDFRMLVVNSRFCKRARFPENGFFQHVSEWKVPWMSTTGGGWKTKPTQDELTTIKYRAEDLPAGLDLRNAELTVYHMWDESVVGIAKRDAENHVLTFSNPAGHPPGAFGVKKYVVWNVREGMTEPGQWYLDRTKGKVVYWPLLGEDMTKAEVIAPTTESIIRLEGTKEKPVREVTLRGLTLSVTNTPLKAGGFGANKFEGALSIVHSEDCAVQDCTLVNVGGQGIKEWSSTGLRIERCHVHHTGACGIKCGGGDGVVSDCHVHDVGFTYPSAIALWGGGKEGKGWQFIHNEIHDTPYTAIACGGNNHRIEHNLIYAAMKELHDGGGIYITFCKNIVLRGNFIRDIADTGGYGASAYYLDEQAENCLVEGNLSLRVARPSHNHMAKKNTVRNNVFICEGDAQMTLAKSSEYTLERNVFWAAGKITFTNPAGFTARRNNVIFSGKGEVVGLPLKNYSKQSAQPLDPGEGSVFADPTLVEYETGKVRFAPDSPALKLLIEAIDVSGAGRRP